MTPLERITTLMVASEYPPRMHGGLGRHVAEITRALEPYADVHLVLPTGVQYQPLSSNVLTYAVPTTGATEVEYWLRFSTAAVALVQTLDLPFDLIHCHDWMTALVGVQLRCRLSRPLLLNLHLPQFGSVTRLIEDIGIQNADSVIVNTRAVAEDLAQERSTQSKVIPNGVDHAIFCPSPRLQANQADPFIMYCGRFSSQKGIETLLQAIPVLLAKNFRIRVLVVGDGPLDLYLRRLAEYLSIADVVTFMRWQPTAELVDLYRRAAMVVVPSIYEPFGLVALEAMACGTVVLAANVRGLAELFASPHGLERCLFPMGNHLRLAETIAELLSNDGDRRHLADLALTRASEYSWENSARQLTAEYRQLLHQRRPVLARTSPLLLDSAISEINTDIRSLLDGLTAGADCDVRYQSFSKRGQTTGYGSFMRAEVFYQPEQELLAHKISHLLRDMIHPAIEVYLTQVNLVMHDQGDAALATLNTYAKLLQASIPPAAGLTLSAGIYEHFGYRVYLAIYLPGYLLPSRNLQTQEQLGKLFPAVALRGRMLLLPAGLERIVGSDEALSPFRPLEMGGIVEVDFGSEADLRRGISEGFAILSQDVLEEARSYARRLLAGRGGELNLGELGAALQMRPEILERILDRSGVDPLNDFVQISVDRKSLTAGKFTKVTFTVSNRSRDSRDLVFSVRGPVDTFPLRVAVKLAAGEQVKVPMSISPKAVGEFPIEVMLGNLEDLQLQRLLSPHHFWMRVKKGRPAARD